MIEGFSEVLETVKKSGTACNIQNVPKAEAAADALTRNCAKETGDTINKTLKSRLIKCAAVLLTQKLSDIPEDYNFKIPNYMIKMIEKHNDFQRLMAIELKAIADAID